MNRAKKEELRKHREARGFMKYKVLVDDNFHFADESARTTAGEYDTAEEALVCAKKIVDTYLTATYRSGMSANKLYEQYVTFGEDPYIEGPARLGFSAREYARTRTAEICAKKK